MNLAQNTIHFFSLALCLVTAGSVFLHDTNVDKAAMAAVTTHPEDIEKPVIQISSKPHTHSERGSLYQAIRDLNASQPRVQPRNHTDKRYAQSKASRGHHPFGDVMLPKVS